MNANSQFNALFEVVDQEGEEILEEEFDQSALAELEQAQ
jgi:hypothetical protein